MTARSRRTYAELFDSTIGDRLRLADTALVLEVEADYTLRAGGYGHGVKFGGGKPIGDGMGQGQVPNGPGAHEAAHCVITSALIVDHWSIVKADIAIKSCRIAAIGKAGNPDVQPGVDIVIGPGTEIISAKGLIATAGGTGPATGTFATACTPMVQRYFLF